MHAERNLAPEALLQGGAGKASRKAIVAGTLGHVLEWFDFGVYAYVAAILAQNFFPSDDPTASLLASFAAFGVGFAARPVGGYFFGKMGDKRGRRAVLLATLLLMAVATLGIAATPDFATIGVAAPVLLVIFRLLQGFSAGGETTTAAAFLVEWAPPNKRGFFGSFMQIGSAAGLLLGTLVVALVTTIVGTDAMAEWGWRIPFIIGGILAPIAFVIRMATDETPLFKAAVANTSAPAAPAAADPAQTSAAVLSAAQTSTPASRADLSTNALRRILRAFLFTMFWSVAFYFFLTYMPTFLQREFNVAASDSLWINTIAMVFYICIIPIAGALSDKYGRKPLLISSCVGFIVLPWPLFTYLTGGAPFGVVLVVVLLVGLLLALYTGPAAATLAEFFPTATRSSGMAIGYSLSTVIFGGFTPYIATWLINVTGYSLAPVLYVGVVAVAALLFIMAQKEKGKQEME